MFVFGGEACAIQPEVRYFRTSNRIFPGSFVSRPLVKGNEDPGYEGASSTCSLDMRNDSLGAQCVYNTEERIIRGD